MTETQKTGPERLEETRQSQNSPQEGSGPNVKGARGPNTLEKVARYAAMPAFLGLVCLALYLWVGSLELDSIEKRTLNADYITQRIIRHLEITVVATVIVVALSVTAGILLTRSVMRRISPYIVGIASTGQAVPSIGVLVLFAIFTGNFGFDVAVIALIVYAFLPVLRNTMVGIQQVDPFMIEAGRGMGMTKIAVLFRIELPLAIPIMLAGIRTALIIVVGTAALATFINAGGMGDIINTGIKLSRDSILVTGATLTAVLALAVDYVAGVAEDILRPRGL